MIDQIRAERVCPKTTVLAIPSAAPGQKPPENPIITQVQALLLNSKGNGSVFLTSLPGLAGGMMGQGGLPIGMVMDIKDPAKASKAMEALAKLAGQDASKPGKPYRKIKIVALGGPVKAAITKDRLIIAMSQIAMTEAIDTALDKSGGFAEDSKTAKLVKLAGDGSGVFQMDMSEMIKMVWPLLIAAGEQADKRGHGSDFPLTSIPSAGKMARMLGPEVAVFKPDKGGLLMKSRGKIPFITKMLPLLPTFGGGMFYMMMR